MTISSHQKENRMVRLEAVRSFLFILSLTLIISTDSFAWPAKVVSVSDGDTITVLHSGHQEKIRLYGIDSPEKAQDYGQKAKDLTGALIAGRNIDVETKTVDRYGRTVGLVTVDGQSLNKLIVQNGYAWVYRQYCKERFCSDWVRLEEIARQQKKGLWAGSNIVPPWEWRHQPKETKKVVDETPTILIGDEQRGSGRGGGSYRCGGRTYCSQMTSCEEAKWFLKNCPGTKMDGDNDGVPCEKQWCR